MMAVLRSVNTKFWTDPYVQELEPLEKLLFLYFLTNPLANLAGVYEISVKQIAFDTDLTRERILKTIEKFTGDRKAIYVDGYIILPNHAKHQKLNDSMRININRTISDLPKSVSGALQGIETPGIQPAPSLSPPALQVEGEVEVKEEVKIKERRGTIIQRATIFRKEVFEIGLKKYGKQICAAFVDYWNEADSSKKFLRHEGEKYFAISRRLSTWVAREKDFKPPMKQSPEVNRILGENYKDPKYVKPPESITDIINEDSDKVNKPK